MSSQNSTSSLTFLMVASYADSIVEFRGDFILDLVRKGIDVHVAAPFSKSLQGRAVGWLRASGVTVHELPFDRTGRDPWRDFKCFLELLALVRRLKPRFIFAYTIKPVIYGMVAAFLMRVPIRAALITGLGFSFTDVRAPFQLFLGGVYRHALRLANVVIFQNSDDQALLLGKRKANSKRKVAVVGGSGINTERFDLAPVPQSTSFLFIGRLTADKGVREYVSAARRIRAARENVECKIAGWIDENPRAIHPQELDEWIASGAIDYLGRLDDVRSAIAKCSVFVLPSYREGLPRIVLEAMSMGRAIITTDVPGCRETVIDGRNGLLVPSKDDEALYRAMSRFVATPDLAISMGRASRAIAKKRFDVRMVNSEMLNLLGI